MVNINPKIYGLQPNVKLKRVKGVVFVVINRKSRVIMKDGHRILKIVKKIKQIEINKSIGVLSSAPICSKTKEFLFQNDIIIKTA